MDKIFGSYRQPIEENLKKVFNDKSASFAELNPWGKDVTTRLGLYSTQGKLIRGALVFLAAKLYGFEQHDDILQTATAVEILHSSLLIHDDIMDQDDYRRGQLSIHAQYTKEAKYLNRPDPAQKGMSFGICTGDIGFFMAMELLTKIQSERKQAIMRTVSEELAIVGLAQMQDVMPFGKDALTIDDIVQVYKLKTGRYSISLPLILGAILAGADEESITLLETYGECVGIVFQIVDDRLGLFGTITETGKPIGTDIRDDKKTIYRALLFNKANPKDLHIIQRLYGKQQLTLDDINVVKSFMETYGIEADVIKLRDTYRKKALECVARLPVTEKDKTILSDLVTVLENRTK